MLIKKECTQPWYTILSSEKASSVVFTSLQVVLQLAFWEIRYIEH